MRPGPGCQLPNCANIADVFWSGLESNLLDASQGLADGWLNDNILEKLNSLFSIIQPKVKGFGAQIVHASSCVGISSRQQCSELVHCCRASPHLHKTSSASYTPCCQHHPILYSSPSRTSQRRSMPHRAGSRPSQASQPLQEAFLRCCVVPAPYILFSKQCLACKLQLNLHRAMQPVACAGVARLLWRRADLQRGCCLCVRRCRRMTKTSTLQSMTGTARLASRLESFSSGMISLQA